MSVTVKVSESLSVAEEDFVSVGVSVRESETDFVRERNVGVG